MKKGILISAIGLAAIVLSGCQNTQTGVGGSAPTNSNITQSQRSSVKTHITVDLNGGQLKGSSDTTKTFEVRFSTMWKYIRNGTVTQELPKADEIDYNGHELQYYSLDPRGDEEIDSNYAFVEDITIYAHYGVPGDEYAWVRWQNDDESELNTEKYIFGETPYYHGWTPKSSVDPDKKAFSGWAPHLEPIPFTPGEHPQYVYTARYISLTQEWTVTFHYNYVEKVGEEKITKQVIHDGGHATDPEPTRTGFDFFGWYIDPSFGGDKYDFTAEVHNDLDLYAKWDDAKVTIRFNLNGGERKSGDLEVTVKYGTRFGDITKPDVYKKGYGRPEYWTLDSVTKIDEGYEFIQPINNVFAYYGQPKENYNITFLCDGGEWSDGTEGNKVISVLFGSVPSLGTVTLTKNDNGTIYSAVNWENQTTQQTGLQPVDGHTTYKPIWDITAYDITFNANGGYFGSDQQQHTKIVKTDKQKIPTCEDPKRDQVGTTIYTFGGWEPSIKAATEPTEYKAKWIESEDRVTITFNANKGTLVGSETLSVLRGTAFGTVQNVPTATNTGYTFIGWGDSPSAIAAIPAATPITDDTILYAVFGAQEFTITFKTGGGNWVSGHDGDRTVKCQTGEVPNPNDTLNKAIDDYRIKSSISWKEVGASSPGLKPATKNTTYEPVWSEEPTSYIIYFYPSPGYFPSEPFALSREVITKVGEYPQCESPVRDPSGTTIYRFAGWDYDVEPAGEWSIKEYKTTWTESYDLVYVNFNFEGGKFDGERSPTVKVERGTSFANPIFLGYDFIEKEGYEYDGWSYTPGGSPVIPFLVKFNDDLTNLYAVFRKKTFTITYDNDGGIWSDGSQEVKTEKVKTDEIPNGPSESLTKHDAINGITYTSSGWIGGLQPAFSDKTYKPIWTAQAYDITFDAGGGYFDNNPLITQKTISTPIGQIPSCVNPVRADDGINTYEFIGWSPELTQALGKTTYVAQWKSIPSTQYWNVSFVENDGSLVEDQKIENGKYAMEPRTTRDKYEFKGWSTEEVDPNLEHLFNFTETPITDNIILYAQWEEIPDSYEIIFETQGGSLVPSQTVVSGSYVIEPAAPTKDEYIFKGWLTKPDDETSLYKFDEPVVDGGFTLYAWWEKAIQTFEITFDAQGATTQPAPQMVQENGTIIEPAAPTKPGFDFLGWFTEPEGGELFDFSTKITSSFKLYAQWKAETKYFEVSFDTQGGSTNPATQSIEEGKLAIEPKAPTKEGFIFKGWSIYKEITSDDQLFSFATSIQEPTSLYAIWEAEPAPIPDCTVHFNAKGGTTVPDQTVKQGETIVEPKSPTLEGYTFKGWSTDASTYTPFEFSTPITEVEMTLYAFYDLTPVVQKYKVQFLDKDTELPLVDEQMVVSGETAIEPKDPTKKGYVFRGWSTSKTEYVQFSFKTQIVDDTPLYAFWNEATKYHQVSFNSVGGTEVPSQKVQDGKLAIEPQDPYLEGKIFAGWFKDESYTQEFNFNDPIYDDIELFAKWEDMPTPTTYSNYWFGDLSVDTQDQYALLIGDDQTPHYSGEMGEFDKDISTFTITPISSAELPDKEQIVVYVNQVKLNVDADFTYVDGKITLLNPPTEAYSISIGVAPKESPGPIPPVPGETITVSLVANEVTSWVTHMDILNNGTTVGQVESFKTFTIGVADFDELKVIANSHSHIPSIANIGLYIDGMPITITSAMYDASTGVFNLEKCYEAYGGTPQYSIIVVVDGGKK